GPRAVVQFHIDAEMAAPPWPIGRLDPDAGAEMAAHSARFVGGERYEQLYRMTGFVRIDQEELHIAGTGMRTHRRGTREMERWHAHSWHTALCPSGRAFGLLLCPGEEGPAGRSAPSLSQAFVVQAARMYPAQ